MEQAKFASSPLGKAFEKQTEKRLGAIKSLDLSNKKDELNKLMIHFHRIWWTI